MFLTTIRTSQGRIHHECTGYPGYSGAVAERKEKTLQLALFFHVENGKPQPDSVHDCRFVGVAARAEDARGTPTQSHISPIILVYEDK